jgi:hypothetical protein
LGDLMVRSRMADDAHATEEWQRGSWGAGIDEGMRTYLGETGRDGRKGKMAWFGSRRWSETKYLVMSFSHSRTVVNKAEAVA